jgi:hypothetical protein
MKSPRVIRELVKAATELRDYAIGQKEKENCLGKYSEDDKRCYYCGLRDICRTVFAYNAAPDEPVVPVAEASIDKICDENEGACPENHAIAAAVLAEQQRVLGIVRGILHTAINLLPTIYIKDIDTAIDCAFAPKKSGAK